jgi:acetyltransferase-like isoleucine patch superfamily enzyme
LNINGIDDDEGKQMNPIVTLFVKLICIVQRIKFGKKFECYGFPVVVKSRKAEIQIGDGCAMRSSFFSNLVGLYQRVVVVARGNAKLKIGNHVRISGATIYANQSITIGDYTLIGANVKILDNDFHPIDPQLRRASPGLRMGSKPVMIGENVFIGCNSLILKGVTIGNNAVIGAGSVICRDVPPDTVVAGNPAQVIKSFSKMENM